MKGRAWFYGQLIGGEMLGAQIEGALDVSRRRLDCLVRNPEHEVERDVGEARRARGAEGALGVAARVHPVELLQRRIVEGLDADADAVHARFSQRAEALGLRSTRVRLERDLAIRRQVERRGDEVQNAPRLFRREQRGRAAAEEYRGDLPAFERELLDAASRFLHQRVRVAARPVLARVAFFQQGVEGVGVEIAIPALGDAEGDVDVER